MQIYCKRKNVIRHITDDLEVCRDDSHEKKTKYRNNVFSRK